MSILEGKHIILLRIIDTRMSDSSGSPFWGQSPDSRSTDKDTKPLFEIGTRMGDPSRGPFWDQQFEVN